MGIVILFL